MKGKETLRAEIEAAYHATEGLLDLVEDSSLSWKPATGANWMTTAQLLYHLGDACGACMRGFATGDWGMPKGVDPSQIPPDQMQPPAEKMPAVASVAEARQRLAEDKKLAFEVLDSCSEERLTSAMATAPWDPRPLTLGHRFFQMVEHLNSHKAQLFYYLKLQGKPVHTGHLWGM